MSERVDFLFPDIFDKLTLPFRIQKTSTDAFTATFYDWRLFHKDFCIELFIKIDDSGSANFAYFYDI